MAFPSHPPIVFLAIERCFLTSRFPPLLSSLPSTAALDYTLPWSPCSKMRRLISTGHASFCSPGIAPLYHLVSFIRFPQFPRIAPHLLTQVASSLDSHCPVAMLIVVEWLCTWFTCPLAFAASVGVPLGPEKPSLASAMLSASLPRMRMTGRRQMCCEHKKRTHGAR